MKRSSKIICGLLMSWLCFRVTGLHERISVTQSPDNIAVNEGESAEITCCWTQITKEISNVKVFWLKDDTKVSVEIQIYQKSPSQNCSTLHMANITSNDTGEYVCKVTKDIPVLTEVLGNKTILSIIKDRQGINATTTTTKDFRSNSPEGKDQTPAPSLTLYLSLAAVVCLLTICLVFTVCRMRNYCKNTDRVVIRQTPHSEGEEHENHEEVELNSGSSRGSLQWYQVPVYWSYFDVQSTQDQ